MKIVNIHDAKTHFSKLIQETLNGEEIIIARGNQPLVRLSIYEETPQPRKSGQLSGMIKISEDFDAPLPIEYQHFFEGKK